MKAWAKYGLIFLLVLGFVSILTYQMFSLAERHCELCIEFKGRQQCSNAFGPDEAAAIEEAHRNACALLASGVTEVLACNRAERLNISCKP